MYAARSTPVLPDVYVVRTNSRPAEKLDRARDDPNEFIEYCFTDPQGRPLRQSGVHRSVQDFLTHHPKGIIELPRDHGKTTQVCGRILWELGHDPRLRVQIFCASEALASERGQFIRDALETNSRLREVFPHLKPGTPWAGVRFSLERPATVIGPTVTTIGIGSASTGARADLLICDDVVDVKALASRAERDRVKQRFRDNLMNLLEPDGRFWGLCTPWHRDDLNADLKRNAAFALLRRGVGDDLRPVWPERWPATALQSRRDEIGAAAFARGFRLVPLADEDVPIRPAWVRFWTEPMVPDRVIVSVDPAVSIRSGADQSAIVVLARCGNEVRCLATAARRVAAPELIQMIESVDATWRADVILFEANAAFKGIADLMTRQAAFGPKVKAIVQTKDKGARVAAFSVPVENGTFRLKGDGRGGPDPAQQPLMDEMTTFPLAEHDDLLDATATGTAYLLGASEPRIW